MKIKQIWNNGIFKENPVLVLLLGMCPSLATSTSVQNAVGMGISAAVVLICSNIIISLLRKVIPEKIRIAAFVVVIACFVSLVEMVLKAYFPPEISKSLGIFIPLIVVNCIILARAEAFASKNGVIASAVDGLAMGIGFTGALAILATIREILGNGTFLGYQIFGAKFQPAVIMILPPGGFIALGLLIGATRLIGARKKTSKKKTLRKSRRLDANKIKYRLEGGGIGA